MLKGIALTKADIGLVKGFEFNVELTHQRVF